MSTPKYLIAGVDIGGTKTAVVLANHVPSVLTRSAFATQPELGSEQAIERILTCLQQALSEQGYCAADLSGIGISCGGPLDTVAGLVQSPPNLSTWQDVPIRRILEEHFGVPCYLENDANAGALAEFRFGAGVGTKNFIFLTMGTGFGAGLILNGELYQGATSSAGEIGHVRLSEQGPIGYGKNGSVEGWASGGGMAQVANTYVQQALLDGTESCLTPLLHQGITARDVAAASLRGDKVADQVVQTVSRRLGETLALLIDILDPECIAIGGLALRFGERLLGPAREIVQQEALHRPGSNCRIVPAALGEEIGDIAALCIALNGLARQASAHENGISGPFPGCTPGA